MQESQATSGRDGRRKPRSARETRAHECIDNIVRTAGMAQDALARWLHRHYRLSPTAGQVLAIIAGAAEPLTPRVISERIYITTGTMTSILDTLERRGFVRRMPHSDDRRKTLVDITDEARTVLAEALPTVRAAERRWASCLSADEQAMLLDLLAKIRDQITAYPLDAAMSSQAAVPTVAASTEEKHDQQTAGRTPAVADS